MPKTGFSNGFADVPTQKYYKYHGLVRECNIEPILPPYGEYQTDRPVITTDFSLNYWNDCYAYSGISYADVHERVNAARDAFMSPSAKQLLLQPGNWWEINRILFYFYTASIPEEKTVSSAKLHVYVTRLVVTNPFDVIIQSGMPEFPHYPYQETDNYHGWYSGNGGSINSGDLTLDTWAEIPLNPGWVNKAGWTKFIIRLSGDINNVPPGVPPEYALDRVSFKAYPWPNTPILKVKYYL